MAVKNLCMCDIDDDDPSVDLHILGTLSELATEPCFQRLEVEAAEAAAGIVGALETFARDNELHVLAMEGTVDDRGTLWVFDVNTNSNYNMELER